MDSPQDVSVSPVVSPGLEIGSPGGKSRYGRTRRPKISRDFYNIDDVIIDEPFRGRSPLKSPKLKPPLKPPVIRRDVVFEIKDEFTKLDDLGMKVANNFKSNLQRGLDDSIKERKFFKSMPEKALEVPNVVDVTKVFKLISNKPAVISEVYEAKSSPKTTLKTYTNKRKHLHDTESFIIESFGLPDEPIIPIKSPILFERNTKIDIDISCESDVNLKNPWTFEEFEPLYATEPANIDEMSFARGGILELFTCDSAKSENMNFVNSRKSTTKQTPKIGKKRLLHREASEAKMKETKKVSPLKKKAKVEILSPRRVLRSNADNDIEKEAPKEVNLQTLQKEESPQNDSILKKALLKKDGLLSTKNSSNEKLTPIKITQDLAEIESQETPSINVKFLRSSSVNSESSTPAEKVINPAKIICSPNIRVILNPLACMDKILENKALVPNPFKKNEDSKVKEKTKTKNRPEKTETKTSEEQHLEIKQEIIEFEVGDLAWAKLGTFPYWPCLITEEPFTGMHKKFVVNRAHPMYHVRFFGDKGRRSWVTAQHLMLYYERDDLERLAKILKAQEKIKSSYIKECCVIKSKNKAKWEIAVREAESLKFKTVQERLDYFFNLFASKHEKKQRMKELGIKEELLEEESLTKNKERLCVSEDDQIAKKVKEEIIEESEEVKLEEKEKSPMKKLSEIVEFTSPEVPKKAKKAPSEEIRSPSPQKRVTRSSLEETSDEDLPLAVGKHMWRKSRENTHNQSSEKKKFQRKEQFSEECLEARKKLRNSSLPPKEEAEEIEENATPKLRNKRHQISGENSNSDTDSKFSDNSSVPTSLESQAALHRRNNIFRGIPKEKVCQICEKSGEVFKCKGPCSGVYHYECAVTDTKEGEGEKVEKEAPTTPEKKKNTVEIISVNSKKPLPKLSASPNYKGMSLAEKIDLRMKEIMKKFDHQTMYSESTDSSSEELLMEESFEKVKNQSKLSLTVTAKPNKKEVPIIKHVTADNISYICVTNESPPKDEKMAEILKDTLKHFKCHWCTSDQTPKCLVCNKEESKQGSKFRQKCSLHQCGKYYHPECLKSWPQTQWSLIQKKTDTAHDTFVCPRHVCHTCISDDPRAANSRCPSDKVVKCLRCPATYHSSNYCVPAGSHILSTSQIVCPRHFTHQGALKKRFQPTINTNWCFICSKGGNLICCETCPTSVHVECLPGDLNEDDTFYCEDCQSGRLPLYDEIVWVKLGTFRWWPALILFPNEVPDNVKNIKHNKGEFVVKFFGTYDHYWVGRGRTFLFQEGDKGHSTSHRKRVDNAFVKAIEEAAVAHQLKKKFKSSKVAEKNNGLKPPPYIRIKVNKPVGNVKMFEGNTSNTTSCDCDPNQPHPCGPDSDCLNRLLLTECNPEMCPAGARCNNQCFEKREYPPLLPHRTQVRGWGLKTLAPIRKGQFVIEYVGEMIDEQEYQRRIQKMHEQKEENYYFLTIDKDRTLDAGPKGNVARFMNHSCQPNCETQKWTVNGDTRVGLFAKCDIPADTELTFNYNLECIGKEKKICRCGAPNCSGFIGVKVKLDAPKKSSKPKKKKTPPPQEVVDNPNPCFICAKTGDVGPCNNKICTKFYHLGCVGLKSWPEGNKWVCQWHNCNFCSKRTIRCCVKCVNSYCPPHSEGNVRYDKLLGFVCTEHDPNKESIEPAQIPKSADSSTEEGAVTSTTPEELSDDVIDSMSLKMRLNGCVTSTPVKKVAEEDSSQDQTVSSASSSDTKKKKRKSVKKDEQVQAKTTANLFNSPIQNEVRLSKFTPTKYLRTSTRNSLNRTDPEKDLPIRKRTRLRCGNSL